MTVEVFVRPTNSLDQCIRISKLSLTNMFIWVKFNDSYGPFYNVGLHLLYIYNMLHLEDLLLSGERMCILVYSGVHKVKVFRN